jgi:hypothetical protein
LEVNDNPIAGTPKLASARCVGVDRGEMSVVAHRVQHRQSSLPAAWVESIWHDLYDKVASRSPAPVFAINIK